MLPEASAPSCFQATRRPPPASVTTCPVGAAPASGRPTLADICSSLVPGSTPVMKHARKRWAEVGMAAAAKRGVGTSTAAFPPLQLHTRRKWRLRE